ncbi:helix-turn-helix domain-containing protein [Saccharopolyspora sp. NPDC000359]|uniref:helix-turn-helix domain-containing protein n=1 Tax=Saccharopolyspora sp. NPDC000359 TaxID=3154251 RepID=UPI00332AAC68
MEETPAGWPLYIDRQLGQRGWEVKDLAAAAGLSQSVIFRWKKGYPPNIKNARAAAAALRVPLLELLAESGVITPEEAGAGVELHPSPTELSDDELIAEMARRVKRSSGSPE